MDARPTPSERADQREHDADAREAALDTREKAAAAKESALARRDQETQAILDAADERDLQADERDAAAGERDQAASLDSFLRDADYSPGHKARLSAGMDRVDSKADRTSSADDRSNLTRAGLEQSELDNE